MNHVERTRNFPLNELIIAVTQFTVLQCTHERLLYSVSISIEDISSQNKDFVFPLSLSLSCVRLSADAEEVLGRVVVLEKAGRE